MNACMIKLVRMLVIVWFMKAIWCWGEGINITGHDLEYFIFFLKWNNAENETLVYQKYQIEKLNDIL